MGIRAETRSLTGDLAIVQVQEEGGLGQIVAVIQMATKGHFLCVLKVDNDRIC